MRKTNNQNGFNDSIITDITGTAHYLYIAVGITDDV